MIVRIAKLPDETDLVIRQVEEMMKELSEREEITIGKGSVLKGLKRFHESFFPFLAIKEDNSICGILNISESFAMYNHGLFGIITEFYVPRKSRHKGIGRLLINHAMEFAQERGWSSIEVSVPLTPKGIHSVEFYEKIGFSHSGPKMKISL